MTEDKDHFIDFLTRVDNVVNQFHNQNVPNELIEDFQRSRLSFETDVQKISQMLSPLVDYLLMRLLEKEGEDEAPVRSKGKMPNSVVANATMEMIDALKGRLDYLPQLRDILILLLNIKSYQAGESRQFEKKNEAALLLALKPGISNNSVAKLVGVKPPTVGRWLKKDDFKRDIQTITELCQENKIFRDRLIETLGYNLNADEVIVAELEKQ